MPAKKKLMRKKLWFTLYCDELQILKMIFKPQRTKQRTSRLGRKQLKRRSFLPSGCWNTS